MTEMPVETKTDLELFAERLARGRKMTRPPQHSPTAEELTKLQQKLQSRLQSGPMDLKLLGLEWRYDLALLLDHMRHWMNTLDHDFNSDH